MAATYNIDSVRSALIEAALHEGIQTLDPPLDSVRLDDDGYPVFFSSINPDVYVIVKHGAINCLSIKGLE